LFRVSFDFPFLRASRFLDKGIKLRYQQIFIGHLGLLETSSFYIPSFFCLPGILKPPPTFFVVLGSFKAPPIFPGYFKAPLEFPVILSATFFFYLHTFLRLQHNLLKQLFQVQQLKKLKMVKIINFGPAVCKKHQYHILYFLS